VRRILWLFLVTAAFVVAGVLSPAHAQAISDVELFAAASQVSISSVDQPGTSNQEALIASEKTEMKQTMQASSALALDAKAQSSIEASAPVNPAKARIEGAPLEGVEGPDLDGPGGSTHEFEGEETGDH